jgi:predicted enzyme related to lactoylglutathione lyase
MESMKPMPVHFERVAPVFPVRDVTAALAHYRRLGFEADPYKDAADEVAVYGFLRRGEVSLHLSRVTELRPKESVSACYLYVDDADALYAEWLAAGAGGQLAPPTDTPYGLREFVHIDPDGNLLRIGSPLRCG